MMNTKNYKEFMPEYDPMDLTIEQLRHNLQVERDVFKSLSEFEAREQRARATGSFNMIAPETVIAVIYV